MLDKPATLARKMLTLLSDFSDPGKWPKHFINCMQQTLVEEGVKQLQSNNFCEDKNNGVFQDKQCCFLLLL